MSFSLFQDSFPDIPDASIDYIADFIAFAKANQLLHHLIERTPWRNNKIKLFGKEFLEPRLTQLYGDPKMTYSYSGIQFNPLPWTEELSTLKKQVEQRAGCQFNVCLLNYYRDGQDSNGWHADDEKELGENPTIASVSLGAERFFHLKHNTRKEWRYKFPLHHGSLLIMKGQTQHTYKHQIAKTKRKVAGRLNLTFREVKR